MWNLNPDLEIFAYRKRQEKNRKKWKNNSKTVLNFYQIAFVNLY